MAEPQRTPITPTSLRAYARVVENVNPRTLERSLTEAATEIELLRSVLRTLGVYTFEQENQAGPPWPMIAAEKDCALEVSSREAAAVRRALGGSGDGDQ